MKWGIALLVAAALISVGWRYLWVLVTLHVIVCFILVIVIMLQSGSAADLAGAFGGAGSQTAFGPRGAASFLSRATTWCAIVFMATSLTLSIKRAPAEVGGAGSILEETTNPAQKAAPGKPATTPTNPLQAPAAVPPPPQAPTAPAQNSAPAPSAPTQQK
jgi:preprotein translocase subunit SecG